jgi:hypothetical protein
VQTIERKSRFRILLMAVISIDILASRRVAEMLTRHDLLLSAMTDLTYGNDKPRF